MSYPVVSICVISYNHEKFIRQALESVANQKVNFSTELIIADDCSRDGTAVIIEAFLKTYKGKSSFLKREKNIGAAANFIEMISTATGKYVAYLEGDDYWTDGSKLQNQIDFLEARPDIALSAHNSTILSSTGQQYIFNRDKNYSLKPYHSVYGIENYIIKDFFHSSAIVYRRSMLPPFPNWYPDTFGGDYFLVLFLAMNGGIHYINKSFSVYRNNADSISHYSSRFEINKNFDYHLKKFNEYSNHKYDGFVKQKIFSLHYSFHYYHPAYIKKIGFAIKNFKQLLRMHESAFPKKHRFRIFLPTFLLKGRTNLFTKKIN